MDTFRAVRELDFDVAVVVVDHADAVATYGNPTVPFEWASVTKLVSTWATLVAVDRGHVSLDDDAGPDGSSLRHLLSHCSGLPFDKGSPIAPPGTKRIYSNRGIEVAADLVARRTGTDFHDWTKQVVLEPLGMDSAEFHGSPAHGIRGTAVDLAEFARAVLNGLLVSPDLVAEATTVQFPGLRGVVPGYGRQDPNDWGLGFEIKGTKDPHWTGNNNAPQTFGHFGWAGSFLWVDPKVHLAAVFVGEQPFSEEHQEAWPELSDAILADHAVLR
ncbi:MAG: class A beta-lactamase-related serine hydrolase [Actinobacteria bacterium]|nr:class A beta-lactamase-related serine hydrolase [Actinomycetota bacterium]